MNTLLKILYQLSIVLLIKDIRLQASVCTDNQYTLVSSNGSRTCVDCFECPKGLAPSVECGSIITPDIKRECKYCISGTFSPSNDFEQCQQCSICSDDQVSKPCTTSRDTICEKKCKSKENYYEKSSDDCQACSSCCGDKNDINIEECIKKGMPAHKTCTVHRKRKCASPFVTSQPTPKPQTTSTFSTLSATNPLTLINSKTTPKYNNLPREITMKKTLNNRNPKSGDSSEFITVTSTEWRVFIGISSGIGFLTVCCLFCLLITQRKLCFKHILRSEKGPALKIIYSTVKSQEDIILVAKDSTIKLFDFFNKDHNIRETICNKLDTKKSFAKLARHYKMDEDKVKKLEERHFGDIPSEEVFNFLEGKVPNLLVGEFSTFMEEIQRVDVIQYIYSKLFPSNEIHVPLDQ